MTPVSTTGMEMMTMAKKGKKKPKKVKQTSWRHLKPLPNDEWSEEAADPITAMQQNVDRERVYSRQALQRVVNDLEELESRETVLKQMASQLKRGGRWMFACDSLLVPGQWYIVRQTRYAGKPHHYYPSGLIVMAKWLKENGGWSAHTNKLDSGTGLCVFIPNSKVEVDVGEDSSP